MLAGNHAMNNIKLIDRSYFVTTLLWDMKVYPIYSHDID